MACKSSLVKDILNARAETRTGVCLNHSTLKIDTPLCHLLAHHIHLRSVTSTFTEDDALPPVAPFVRSKFPILWFIYNTHIRTHSTQWYNFYPCDMFRRLRHHHQTVHPARYLKRVKMTHICITATFAAMFMWWQAQWHPVTWCMRS